MNELEENPTETLSPPAIFLTSSSTSTCEATTTSAATATTTTTSESVAIVSSSSISSAATTFYLSKNQQKKKRKYEQAIQIKAQRKLHDKEVKYAKAIAQGRNIQEEKRQMEENRLRNKQLYGINYSIRGLQTFQQKLKITTTTTNKNNTESSFSFQICLDCSFEPSMTEKEISSLATQIRYCYAANKKSPNPVLFSLSNLSPTGKIWDNLIKISGFPDSWLPRGFSYSSESFMTMYKKPTTNTATVITTTTTQDLDNSMIRSKLVYLTSDSDNILDQLEDGKIYIIGGIVDRNRLKGATLQKAQELNIVTAKLPITQYLHLFTTKVLVCNHVFEILLKCKENGCDWKKAMMDILPARKQDVQETSKKIGSKKINESFF